MAPLARTILLPVNESVESSHTVHWAAKYLLCKEDRVVLLYLRPQMSVFDHYVKADGSGTAVADGKTVSPDVKLHMVEDTYQTIGEDVLHKAGQPIEAEGIHYESKVVESGDVQEAICAAAKELGATLVVIGGREMGFVQRTLMGSISDHVLHHAPCPVLLVKRDEGHSKETPQEVATDKEHRT